MAFSFFQPITNKNPFECFDFNYIDRLFVENRLVDWIGEKKGDGTVFQSLADFFQPNYIATQMKAFFWGLDTVPDELNFSWISELHHRATQTLFHESGSPIPHHVRRDNTDLVFPNILHQTAYGSPSKASPAGIESLSKEISDPDDEETKGKVLFGLTYIFGREYKMKPIDAETAKQYYEQQQRLFNENEQFLTDLVRENNINPAGAFAGIKNHQTDKAALNDAINKIIAAGCRPLFRQVSYCLLNRNPFQIRAKAEKLIKAYNQSPKHSEDEKIDAIVILVKGLLNLHVWQDGNGRLCAHHLLNLLLIENGLCPALLKNNCLDAFTLEELRERVKEGMRLFNGKCTNVESMYESFRNKNELTIAKESEFITAIVQNKIEEAKTCLQCVSFTFTNREMEFFASCPQADVNWFAPYFRYNKSLYTWNDLLSKLTSLALQYANENLMCSLLAHYVNHNIVIPSEHLNNVLIFGNFKMFQILKPVIENPDTGLTKERFFELIPVCKDSRVASEMMDWFAKDTVIADHLMEDMFLYQQPSVILKFLTFDDVKEASRDIRMLFLINKVKYRDDLSPTEINQILRAIHPYLKCKSFDPLEDFVNSSLLNVTQRQHS